MFSLFRPKNSVILLCDPLDETTDLEFESQVAEVRKYYRPATVSQMLREGTAVTADAGPRASGGRILNAQGEVVGVYSSGLPQSGAAFPFRVSYGGNSLIQGR